MLPCGWPHHPLFTPKVSLVWVLFKCLLLLSVPCWLWMGWYFSKYVIKRARIKRHIERVINKKKPEDRKFFGSLDVNDYVSLYPNFLSEKETNNISSDLKSFKKFSTEEMLLNRFGWALLVFPTNGRHIALV